MNSGQAAYFLGNYYRSPCYLFKSIYKNVWMWPLDFIYLPSVIHYLSYNAKVLFDAKEKR